MEVNNFNEATKTCNEVNIDASKEFTTKDWNEAEFLLGNICDSTHLWGWVFVMNINNNNYYVAKSDISNAWSDFTMNMLEAKFRVAIAKNYSWKDITDNSVENIRFAQKALKMTNWKMIYVVKELKLGEK